ncbi:hypothetical protein SH1V18_11770 [Vallitalea longa]|uniref:Uncharacterized protein n=1 Tax=Vallitalea longa TaxID=2936439 RepID=A0A9W6DEQ4_9FIRM|nr:hypothetical protein [Vallitalea longa]GKX28697.1 hypothetical protein SH1V18_11770 [Vallitalea longa]
MEKNNSTESIKKEQLLLLYENLIDDAYNLYNSYKTIHNNIISHINKNIVQDIMKLKLNQSRELINLYKRLSCMQYINKPLENDEVIGLSEMFAKESNHGEILNYIYANIKDKDVNCLLQVIINNENLILLRLLYLQSLLGINWKV